MSDPKLGWGLPPGVTDRHIDERFGDDDESPEDRRQRIEEEKGEAKADMERGGL